MTSRTEDSMDIVFRCPKELEQLLPPPIAAPRGLPDWLKEMPSNAFSGLTHADDNTVKRCPPFIDAMTSGFLIPLICDVRVKNLEFDWDIDLPAGGEVDYLRSPMGLHDPSQLTGTPIFDPERFLIKFHNLWTIEAPAGYSLLFTHPVNRFDLPFTTLTGLVECDSYRDAWIHFPARWNDVNFEGILKKGTPIAQCFPIKRDHWSARVAVLTPEEIARTNSLTSKIVREKGVYRRDFRT